MSRTRRKIPQYKNLFRHPRTTKTRRSEYYAAQELGQHTHNRLRTRANLKSAAIPTVYDDVYASSLNQLDGGGHQHWIDPPRTHWKN